MKTAPTNVAATGGGLDTTVPPTPLLWARRQVAARTEQGLPPTVTDVEVLDAAAVLMGGAA